VRDEKPKDSQAKDGDYKGYDDNEGVSAYSLVFRSSHHVENTPLRILMASSAISLKYIMTNAKKSITNTSMITCLIISLETPLLILSTHGYESPEDEVDE